MCNAIWARVTPVNILFILCGDVPVLPAPPAPPDKIGAQRPAPAPEPTAARTSVHRAQAVNCPAPIFVTVGITGKFWKCQGLTRTRRLRHSGRRRQQATRTLTFLPCPAPPPKHPLFRAQHPSSAAHSHLPTGVRRITRAGPPLPVCTT